MNKKVILISVDGIRSDGLKACGNEFLKEMENKCAYTYEASSMNPSVTFPCHYSMAHSVTPQRHGLLKNTSVPPVRPVDGIVEKIKAAGGISAMFYGWEPLRDIARPGALKFSTYIQAYMQESGDTKLTDEALDLIAEHKPDFVFLYLVETDEKGGHDSGWMSDEYLRIVKVAIDNVKRVFENCGDEYSIIVMADHGGHGRSHGSDLPEDMIIPLFFYGDDFAAGNNITDASLLDIAPTIADIMGIPAEPEWEGRSLINNR